MKKISFFILFLSVCSLVNAKVFNVLDYGAKSNGSDLTTADIQKTIDACAADGGGQVYVPKGTYLVGTLNLKSNVEFHFETGAMLKATTDLTQYQKHNEQPAGVFYTQDQENVSITGNGVIFGQGMEFMSKEIPKRIMGPITQYIRQGANFRKTDGAIADGPLEPKDRFHQMIIFSNCVNVSLSDFKCLDAPYWTFLIVHCNKVKARGLEIQNNLLIPNSDGLDIVSSSNVNVSDCIFKVGDDAIVLAGYAHHYGDPGFQNIIKTSENINISNCILQSRSSGIRIGGWDQNNMKNYNFNNISIIDSNCGINLTVRDSGSIENVNFSNIRIETRLHTGDWWGNGEPIKISAMPGIVNDKVGFIRNINFTNITSRAENGILIYASNETSIENITFTNFDFILKGSKLEASGGGNFDLRPNIVKGKELYKSDIPVVYIENAKNVYFNQGNIGWDGVKAAYYTNAIKAVKVTNMKLNNMTASASPTNPKLPIVSLTQCTGVVDNITKQ